MRPPTALVIWLAAAALPVALSAPSAGADDGLARQRQDFTAAERLFDAGRSREARALLPGLSGYPLLPYLEYADLSQRLDRASGEEVRAFLAAHERLPVVWRLHRAWLRRLFREGRWGEFLADYRPTSDTVTRCHYRLSQYHSGDTAGALDGVAELWLVGSSQPDACDPLFDLWREAGGLTPALAWKRVALAMGEGRPSLARYLLRYLPAGDRPLGELWLRVHQDPAVVLQDHGELGDDPRLLEVLAHGIRRWARRDGAAAAAAWDRLRQAADFPPSLAGAVERALGLARLGEDPAPALVHLERVPDPAADPVVRDALLRGVLALNDWNALLARGARLPAAVRAREDWTYWRGRALEATGAVDRAREVLAELAGNRSYYGYLAADRLGLPYRFNHRLVVAEPEVLERLRGDPVVARVREFYALGRPVDARREWYAWMQRLTDSELEAAAVLAHERGWHFNTILTLGRREAFDDVERRFPLAFRDPLVAAARAHRLDPAWVYAVVRQESAFEPTARSPAGALGLMQVMPRTGRMMARRLDLRLEPRRDLLDAQVNLRLGSAYLRALLEDLDGSPVLATAAYNAGPQRVRQWLPADGPQAADRWVEQVPFRETRGYLRKVFFYTAIYEHRLGETPTRLGERMGVVEGK